MPPPPPKTLHCLTLLLPEGACCRDTELKTIMISRSTVTTPRPRTENPQKTSIWRLCFCQFPLTNQLYCNLRHCTEKQQQFWCAHRLLPAPPKHSQHLSLSYCKLFVTSVPLYSLLGRHSPPQTLHPFFFFFFSLALSLDFLRPFGVSPNWPNTSF